jgi:8-oxo-dGTP pyrophosphatase MutT (NUDIX family)
MHRPDQIRVLALGLIRDGERLFVSEGYDPRRQQTFYRAMGGGVEFGETSREALEREFQEEIGAALANICYLGCLENLFTFNGQPGHELIQLYACDFADPAFYRRDRWIFNEGKRQKTALWVETERFRSGEFLLVPEQFQQYL